MLVLATVDAGRPRKSEPMALATAEFLRRIQPYETCQERDFPSESSLLDAVAPRPGRSRSFLLLCHGAGKPLSSVAFADRLRTLRDTGQRSVVLAIGPPNGWSAESLARADLLLSFGPMTLPHALARLLLAEQVYRAMTILAGHPYHTGH